MPGPAAAFFSAAWNAALGTVTLRPNAVLDFEGFSAAGALPQVEIALRFVFDDNGNLANLYFSGVLMKVPLGQGQTFLAAGRLDAIQSEDEFAVVPDSGTIRNRDAFCATLS